MDPQEYDIEYFRNNTFKRQQCPRCGRYFWSQGEHETCKESPCVEYSFIGRPPTKKAYDLHEMREAFLSFFERKGHTRIARYPITARWRDDVFFTQASIYDFQPWVINGTVNPPANPLTISQTCVRFNDIDNIGKTGRHLSMFEMMAHHAFNKKNDYIYFKDRTVELCHTFLTKELGIDGREITYIEAGWKGGGNSGPCLEVVVGGVEVATLVFMMYTVDEEGVLAPMDMQVVDTGYGLERLTWLSQGTPSAYEAVFGPVLAYLKKETGIEANTGILAEYSKVAGIMNLDGGGSLRELRKIVAERLNIPPDELEKAILPLENIYIVSDHTRALMFMLTDGVVPSNVKEGYFARLLVRKGMRALRELGLDIPLHEIVSKQIDYFAKDFPEVEESRESVINLVKVEEEKYLNTVKKGKAIVQRLTAERKREGKGMETDDLILLYDSYGLNPELVREFTGGEIEIPDDFYRRVAEKHEKEDIEKHDRKQEKRLPQNYADTELLYYPNPKMKEFDAEIIGAFDKKLILNRTAFYPEGGGQDSDTGILECESGDMKVLSVEKYGRVVVHTVDRVTAATGSVHGKIDWERRMDLTRHHTATHIVNAAAKQILGRHVWQAGAHKSPEMARLDITHYRQLSEEEFYAIERIANEIIREDIPMNLGFMSREEAERKYGFTLYQGGVVPGKELRIVEIPGVDVEACGGTHCERTGEVAVIKLIRTRRIQDGVLRIEFTAGRPAIEYIQGIEKTLKKVAGILNTDTEKATGAAERLVREWKEARKHAEILENEINSLRIKNLLDSPQEIDGIKVISTSMDGNMKDLMALSKTIHDSMDNNERFAVLLTGCAEKKMSIMVAVNNIPQSAKEILNAGLEVCGGRGGGRDDMAQGSAPVNRDCMRTAEKVLDTMINRIKEITSR